MLIHPYPEKESQSIETTIMLTPIINYSQNGPTKKFRSQALVISANGRVITKQIVSSLTQLE